MHFSTILPVIAVALGAANAAPVDDGVVEPRGLECPHEMELLKLHGVPPGGVYTGVGTPDCCQNLPDNINDFDYPEVTPGFQCNIYTGRDCTGSFITVPGEVKYHDQEWRSWKCTRYE
ncbi:uncharacterized protein BKA55DRAFT_540748 [Fusarium redolens]|uniref:Uncharacterized protein n=1 Tax=Fusarium redolens TaxID=48865 RepID=A0A9P9GXR4_FUSRE|nr:uncharacterized protein BKA55DRAFT_540748 [Fusarium redolens]KAH7247459.1 hypothetical protein BKA55DRAFT_540748 [Fusarium redolens]